MEALEMEQPMNRWNDDRLDELSSRVDEGFKEMREGFSRVDREMKEGFAEGRGEMRHLAERFDRLQHTLVLISWGFAGAVLAAFVGLLVLLI